MRRYKRIAMKLALNPHPDTPCDAIRSFTVEVAREDEPHTLSLVYLIDGDISRLAIPKQESEVRANNLWQHTCLEAFVRAPGGEEYWELNFSPSTRWAAYKFDRYRHGNADAPLSAHWIDTEQTPEAFQLSARLMLPFLPQPCAMAITSVIEEANGAKSYWALRHAPGKPDFHHADGFVLELP
jgi:hypothetical protein